MRTLRNLFTTLFFAAVLVFAACSDDEGGTGSTDTGTDATADQGTPDQTTDQAQPDVGGVCDNPNDTCFTPLPSASGTPRVMIEQINVAEDYVVVKNVNTVDQSLDGWWICQAPNYQALPAGITLGPAATLRINLGQSGTDSAGEIFVSGASPLQAEDEWALYSSNSFDSSSDIEVYLRWGSPADGTGRSDEANAAGLWIQGNFATLCDPNIGIVAVGDGFLPIGFRDLPANCPAWSQ